jgi:uncharacterized protein YcbK (DUF882 family)
MKRCMVMLAVVACLLPGTARADGDHRVLWLRSGEELRLTPFDRQGLPTGFAWRRVTRLFRSSKTERRTISSRLLRTLAQLQRHFGNRRIDLYSGYRVPADRRELDSYHHVGHAADIAVAGVEPRELFEYCRQLQARSDTGLGCGLYPDQPFVHVDVRSRSMIWVDLGHRSYVTDPAGWLRDHPRVGGRNTKGPSRL